jgi:hypothetical protein
MRKLPPRQGGKRKMAKMAEFRIQRQNAQNEQIATSAQHDRESAAKFSK